MNDSSHTSVPNSQDERISWHRYFFNITEMVATRSTCLRRKVGAIAVRNKRILATGYNGPPPDYPHCKDIGCIRQELNIPSGERQEVCTAVHAEQNLLVSALINGVTLTNTTIYCTTFPCVTCAKLLISIGTYELYVRDMYPDVLSMRMLEDCKIRVYNWNEVE